MPNWCNNTLTISHNDPAMIQRIIDHKDSPLQEFIPCPHDPETSSEWYNWRIEHWGTKWDIEFYTMEIFNEGKTMQVTFDSAWSPPLAAYAKLEALGFDVDAFYSETGMSFVGLYRDGKDKTFRYDFTNPKWDEEIGDDDLVEYLMPEYESFLEYAETLEGGEENDAA